MFNHKIIYSVTKSLDKKVKVKFIKDTFFQLKRRIINEKILIKQNNRWNASFRLINTTTSICDHRKQIIKILN